MASILEEAIKAETREYTRPYKRATSKEAQKRMDRIVSYRRGDAAKGILPKSISEICKLEGIADKTVDRILIKAKESGLYKLDEKGEFVQEQAIKEAKKHIEFSKLYPIISVECVLNWKKDMEKRKGGLGLSNIHQRINQLQTFCNEMKVHPETLIQSRDTCDMFMSKWQDWVKSGLSPHQPKNQIDGKPDYRGIIKSMVAPIREFLTFNQIPFRKPETGIWQNQVIDHGKHAYIKLDDNKLTLADIYLQEKYGLDSDEYRLVWTGIESGARITALVTARLEWEEVTKNGKTVYVMKMYESKTRHIKGGLQRKYIMRPQTQEALRAAKEKKMSHLHSIKMWKVDDYLRQVMKDLFSHLGETDPYFYEHAGHSLRHIATQRLLRLTKGNIGLVCKMIGWKIIQEMIDSYGDTGEEEVMAEFFGGDE